MINCNCDPSCYHCLRNYENQLFHSHLNRHEVIQFLEDYHALPFEKVDDNEEELPLVFASSYPVVSSTFEGIFKNELKSIAELSDAVGQQFDDTHLPLPKNYFMTVSGYDDAYILFGWETKKVLVINDYADSLKPIFEQHPSWTIIDVREEGWENKLIAAMK